MESPQTNTHPKPLLFSVRTPKVTESEALESMIELERLVKNGPGHHYPL